MPYKMQWMVPNRVILTQFWGRVSLQDIQQFISDLQHTIPKGTPQVHHISDGLEIEYIDISLKTLQMILRGIRPSEYLGWHIEVTDNPINQMISSIVSRFANVSYRTSDSMQGALSFLKASDDTLPLHAFEKIWR